MIHTDIDHIFKIWHLYKSSINSWTIKLNVCFLITVNNFWHSVSVILWLIQSSSHSSSKLLMIVAVATEGFNVIVFLAYFAPRTDLEFLYQELTKVMQNCRRSRQVVPGSDVNCRLDTTTRSVSLLVPE